MDDAKPRLRRQEQAGGGAVAVPEGDWTAAQLASSRVWSGLMEKLTSFGPADDWDLRQVGALDHLGALTLWDHWGRRWPARVEAHEGQRALLERVAAYPTQAPPSEKRNLSQRMDALGLAV